MNKYFEKLRNISKLQVGFFIVCMAIMLATYYVGIKWIDYKKAVNESANANPQVTCNIDQIVWNQGAVYITGWAIAHDSVIKDVSLVLRGSDDTSVVFETEQKENELVEEYFQLTGEYGKIAFSTEIDQADIEDNLCYEVILAVKYKNNLDGRTYRKNIKTERYVYNDRYYEFNPVEFIEPKFEDNFMKNVVQNGELLFYCKEYTTYIYKYEDYTYWIVGDKFDFSPTGKTVVIYFVGTSQKELLEKSFQENGYMMFDFYFEQNEINLKGESEYRVTTKNVEIDMPITYLKTGLYHEEDKRIVWQKYFYPSYEITGD